MRCLILCFLLFAFVQTPFALTPTRPILKDTVQKHEKNKWFQKIKLKKQKKVKKQQGVCEICEPIEMLTGGIEKAFKPRDNSCASAVVFLLLLPIWIVLGFFLALFYGALLIAILIAGAAVLFCAYWGVLALMGVALAGALIWVGILAALAIFTIAYFLYCSNC